MPHPAEHGRTRACAAAQLFVKAFSRKICRDLRSYVREMCRDDTDRAALQRELEFNEGVARQLPVP
jgi:hypothetical protein